MEAAVQRDPSNVDAWYSLGVKQQENEREAKAIHALRRALELDPNHLPSWVALAISHTNEGNRSGAYEAIQSWVTQNERYKDAVDAFRMHAPERDDMTQHEKFAYLTDCLIHMSRSAGDDIDADIQIALAVLMNTNEVRTDCFVCQRCSCVSLMFKAYDKAKDCFLIALAMRPEVSRPYSLNHSPSRGSVGPTTLQQSRCHSSKQRSGIRGTAVLLQGSGAQPRLH